MKLLFTAEWLRRKIMSDPDVDYEAGNRFVVDHGMIHDLITGKHVTTEPDNEIWNGMTITETCKLLNALAHAKKGK